MISTILSIIVAVKFWPWILGGAVLGIVFVLWVNRKPRNRAGEPINFIGNTETKTFHTLACPAIARASKENLIGFVSVKDAIDHGYKPCNRCLP